MSRTLTDKAGSDTNELVLTMYYHIERASSAICAFLIFPVRRTNIVLYHISKLQIQKAITFLKVKDEGAASHT
jgi:hypothetical protein